MTKKQHRMVIGIASTGLLAIGLFWGAATDLQAQSPAAPQTESQPAPVDEATPDATPKKTPGAKEAEPTADRSRSYRRDKDPLRDFVPSEEIRVDNAVDFPADI